MSVPAPAVRRPAPFGPVPGIVKTDKVNLTRSPVGAASACPGRGFGPHIDVSGNEKNFGFSPDKQPAQPARTPADRPLERRLHRAAQGFQLLAELR